VRVSARRRAVRSTLGLFALVAGCALGGQGGRANKQPESVVIVASETGPRGFRLVAIDEHGDRRFELIAPASRLVQDKNPAISPDGRWIVFSSSRGRARDETRPWIARLGAAATPRRLTGGAGKADPIDAHPVWLPDGAAIVYASTRDGGDFDLWLLPMVDGLAGTPARLTDDPGHEITPTIAPDGTIAFAMVTPIAGNTVESRLAERTTDGTIRMLTDGPADTSPAFSPDGRALVFARPAIHDGTPHSELWWMKRGGADVRPLVVLPLTDESGPVWSPDGRYVFATSVLRGAAGNVVFSSVIHVDLRERPARARILGDRAGAVARLTPAIAARRLDEVALRNAPEYLPELARIVAARIEEPAP
jgi:Tol biopolymer transport system component